MKRQLTTLLTLITLFLTTQFSSAIRTVVIDAGHGGKDMGGTWGKVYEKHLALDSAFRLRRYLQMKGYNVVMTRATDVYLTLGQRTAIANKYRDAIFVSIHINKASRSGATGIETFYNSAEGKKLGSFVHNRMISKVSTTDRKLKHANYYVIRNTRIPSILAEIGFVSNRADRERMKRGYYRDALAKAIADGIIDYDRVD